MLPWRGWLIAAPSIGCMCRTGARVLSFRVRWQPGDEQRGHLCVQVVRAERARVGVEYVLGVGGFDLERVEEEVRPLVRWPV